MPYDPRFDPHRLAKISEAWIDYMNAEKDGRVSNYPFRLHLDGIPTIIPDGV
jgi:hypothetical protein